MDQAVANQGDNPYVGPRPLRPHDILYGRARELQELGDLLLAERIVLLHSPSGAGKTSLTNAGLCKRLRAQGFRVLPPLGVKQAGSTLAEHHPNRYVRSVAECLFDGLLPAERQVLLATAMPCLSDYVRQRPRRSADGPLDSRFELLIFDQFEEICTLDPTDIAAKKAFFEEVGETLRDRNRWALFVIREDHLAEIEAFSDLLPTALACRYRLNLMTIPQAIQAIAEPARAAGRPFPDQFVERLANDLATVTVLHPTGPAETVGSAIEPVQLQVVCHRLWQRRSAGEPAPADAVRTGAVDDALADFYDAALARVAPEQGGARMTDQRTVRDWIERYLIVKPSIRNQIMRGQHATEGLPDSCISALEAEYLVRVDRREGREWIEITHDRMIAPIVASNERWRGQHLHLYQRRAQIWQQNNRSPDMLLSKVDYEIARSWQREHPGNADAVEVAFLKASKDALRRRAAQELHKRKLRRCLNSFISFLFISTLSLVVGMGLLWRQKQEALIEKLNGEALALPQGQYKETLSKAIEAYEMWDHLHFLHMPAHDSAPKGAAQARLDPQLRNIHAALLAGLVSAPPVQRSKWIGADDDAVGGAGMPLGDGARGPAAVRQLAFNPAYHLLAAACADGTVALWNLDRPSQPLMRLMAGDQAWSVAFNRAGDRLAVGSSAGVRVWRIAPNPKTRAAGLVAPSASVTLPLPLQSRTMAVAFSAGNLLAVAQDAGDVHIFDAGDPALPLLVTLHGAEQGVGVISSMTFMKHDLLAFADWKGNIWRWSWRPGSAASGGAALSALNFFSKGTAAAGLAEGDAGIADLAYHEGTDQLAATGWRKDTQGDTAGIGHSYTAVWRAASTVPQLADGKAGRESVSHALAFTPSGAAIAYSGGDSRLLSFMASAAPAAPATGIAAASPVRFQERLFSVAFSPYPQDGGNLVAVGDGEKISLLDVQRAAPVVSRPLALAQPFDGEATQYLAAMTDDGSIMAVTGGAKLEIAWHGKDGNGRIVTVPAAARDGAIDALAMAPGGELIAVAGVAGDTVALFDPASQTRRDIPLALCGGAGRYRVQLAFRPLHAARQLAIANGRSVCVVDIGKGGAPVRVPSFQGTAMADVAALAFSTDGARLAALEGNNTIGIYGTGARQQFAAPVTRATTLRFTPDPDHLAFGTDDADIWTLDVLTSKWRRLDQLHDFAIMGLHFGGPPGAGFMLSTDIDGRMMMWGQDGHGGYNRLGRTLNPKGKPVPTALSGDGDRLLVGGASPRVFDLRMEHLLALACDNVNRNAHAACKREAHP